MNIRLALLTAIVASAVIAAALFVMGQPWVCTCGYVQLWDGNIFSSGNSQHIADWYTLSHILHGVLVVFVGRWLFPRWSFVQLLVVACVSGVAWEVIEHTDFVLDRFRETTINLGYYGDSIVNAVSDYCFMTFGFLLAYRLRNICIIALLVVMEITSAVLGRDSLALTTIMLIHPVEEIKQWQEEIKPNLVN